MLGEKEYKYLRKLLTQLIKAKKTAYYSFNICEKIGLKDFFSEDEEDRFESLTSKFARLSDLIMKKAIKTIEIFELNNPPETVRDAISVAEKRGLISSEFKFVEIRKQRNIIAHEYIIEEDEIIDLYKYVLQNIGYLFDSVDRIVKYCKKFEEPTSKLLE